VDVPALKHGTELEADPIRLWDRYLKWLYQHKELGLYLDVSRIGFTDEFVAEMEPQFAKAFQAMAALESGAISNPDEKRMVGHYWLRKPELAPNAFLKKQIEDTVDRLGKFAHDIVHAKV
jgi:glucose-6-phosphate isomerase